MTQFRPADIRCLSCGAPPATPTTASGPMGCSSKFATCRAPSASFVGASVPLRWGECVTCCLLRAVLVRTVGFACTNPMPLRSRNAVARTPHRDVPWTPRKSPGTVFGGSVSRTRHPALVYRNDGTTTALTCRASVSWLGSDAPDPGSAFAQSPMPGECNDSYRVFVRRSPA
jgi:hypothetical protein